MLHPLPIGISEKKMISEYPTKTKRLSSIIPNMNREYTFKTEEEYYNEYRSSQFAVSPRKAGWDCMRHWEIIANMCVPIIPGVEKCHKAA